MQKIITESEIEQITLDILSDLGYEVIFGPDLSPHTPEAGMQGDIAPDLPTHAPKAGMQVSPERSNYSEVILINRLRRAIDTLNPDIPQETREEAIKLLLRNESPDLVVNNRRFHKMLVDGVDVEYRKDGRIIGDKVWLMDFNEPKNNEFLAINQFTVIENNHNRRPDIVLFVNGIPLAVIELKNPVDENATIMTAFNQFETYKSQIPSLFNYNEILIISDGFKAKAGTITSNREWFLPWKTIDGIEKASVGMPEIEVLIRGMLQKSIFVDLIQHFVVFEQERDSLLKKIAAYHQYHAVNAAIIATYRAMGLPQPSSPALLPGREGCQYRGGFNFSGLVKEVRELRTKQTSAEEILWALLRNRKFLGLKFRRQHQIGSYIVDFYCVEKFLIIELDGSIHNSTAQIKKDTKRDAYLQSLGNTVIRIKNEELFNNPEAVLSNIAKPSPCGRGKGEGNADKRIGVIWHTQGSGKSLSMVFYTGKLVLSMDNPTVVVITDRNDLDDQLFGTFSRCHQLIRQEPVQADSRDKLKKCLKVASGGVVFTTIQKFFPDIKGNKYPQLSDRRNIVVIADEAHRSQYDFIDGFARHMRDALPNASFIGFTGTPIETHDRNTRAVFGDEIDIYDIEQAVNDGATVRIFYESRLVKLELKEKEEITLDPDFEEVTEGEEIAKKEQLKSKWARMEAIVGSEKRIKQIAKDIMEHFQKRLDVIKGKAMIVCMSRRICIELHNEIIKLKPDWYHQDDNKGLIKVIMTGAASDPVEWQEHIRNKQRRREIGDRMKDAADFLKIVIVRDMWLTGFDVPCLHTMYLDKPMRGHGLMQAIARVNRVFLDKPGGLVVDYLGIAEELKKALAEYTESGGKGKPLFNQDEAVALMLEKYEIVSSLFYGFDYASFFRASVKDKMSMLVFAQEHILSQEDGKARCLKYVTELSKAFALAVPHRKALEIRDNVGFFQAVRASLAKFGDKGGKTEGELDSAIQQLISKAISSDEVVDIFQTAGLNKPDISILSDEFLAEVKNMPQKNLALEVLKKLLNDEIKVRSRKNLIQGRSFAEMLKKSIKKYNNKTIEAVKIIEELIELAKKMKEASTRGEKLGLTEDEIAFYDALEVNDSAVKILGDETLQTIARELVVTVRRNINIDWTLKESIQARLRVMVKRVLKKYGYPPNKAKKATQTVLEQATLLCKDWTEKQPSGFVEKVCDIIADEEIAEFEKYVTALPVYSLEAVATTFGKEEYVEQLGWMKTNISKKLNKDTFIARVVGKSMEPTISDGSYCVFRFEKGGSRNGLVVLVESRLVADPETNQKFTIKRYKSEKEMFDDGTWQHKKIILSPDNKEFKDIILENVSEDDFKIVAEFVCVV